MTDFIDQPLPVLAVGLLVTLVLGVVFFQTGRMAWLLGTLASLAVVVGLALIAWFMPTDRKLIRATMDRGSQALVAGDRQTLDSLISPTAVDMRRQVAQHIPRMRVSVANIGRDLEIVVHQATSPVKAVAKFTGRIEGQYDGSAFTDIRPIEVTLHREQDRWLFDSFTARDHRELLGPRADR